MSHPLFSGSAIMFVGNMGANVINYAYHLIMGRLLGPIGYGILASLYSILYLVSIIPSSASVSIVKFISSAKDNELFSVYETIRKFIFKLAIVLALLVIVISPAISKFLHIDNMIPVLLILFFSLITLVNQSTLQGLLKFSGFVIPVLISSLSKLLIGVALILIGWSIFGAMSAIVIGAVLAYLYSFSYIKKHIVKTKVKTINLKPFLKYIKFRIWNPVIESKGTILENKMQFLTVNDDRNWAAGDLFRILCLYNYGGLYTDFDVVYLKDLSPLLNQEFMYKWSFQKDMINGAVMRMFKGSNKGS